ncbi:hypothetical protein DERP_008213 [Dermatophagoides pteronyssinus]|uniref:Uncharacterized protein n=1 Tax=Dermatophagoides pteronyssinus TaxID=6956 RepID=A0ABQ8J6D7_DERPT|nr:hypothetical protein DERP_008213 [Dermatophagoides pteronyssinus]
MAKLCVEHYIWCFLNVFNNVPNYTMLTFDIFKHNILLSCGGVVAPETNGNDNINKNGTIQLVKPAFLWLTNNTDGKKLMITTKLVGNNFYCHFENEVFFLGYP